MRIVVGLGNPGHEYERTRHNMGFLAMDRLSEKLGISLNAHGFEGLFGTALAEEEKVILMKPQTFMNNSGQCVGELLRYYHLEPAEVLVMYDDIDLPLGRLRLRMSGSAGTHNGMRSVVAHLDSQNFPRLRIGVGKPRAARELVDHVLQVPGKAEWELLNPALDATTEIVLLWLKGETEKAMQLANRFGVEDDHAI